jgi:hypothetical protein
VIPPPPPTPNQFKRLLSGRPPQDDFVLSPSQFDLFLECERAAGLDYIDGWRWTEAQDPHSSMALGDRIHDILEAFALTGQKPDLHETFLVKGVFNGKPWERLVYPGQIADAAICLIPPGAKPESEVILTRPNGIRWKVKRDLRIAGAVPEVRDYKTTSDFKYVAEKDLATDTQAQLYGWAEFVETPEATEVLLHWQFLRTKGKPDSKSLYRTENRQHNEAQMQRIDAGAERWIELRRKGARGEIRGADLQPTGLRTGKCDKHFGCPRRGVRCFVTTEELLGVQSMGAIEDKIAALSGRQAAIGNIPPPAGFAPVPAPVAAARPSYWMPGDPMNDDQTYFASKGKPLSFIANMADVKPPAEVSASYDAPAVTPVAVLTGPPIERGFINGTAPGAPTHAAVNPEQAAAFVNQGAPVAPAPVGLDRGALKEEALALGLVAQGSRLGAEALAKLIAGHKAAGGGPDFSPATTAVRLEAAIEKQPGGAYVPPPAPAQPTFHAGSLTSVPAPMAAIPAPATAVVDDDLADRIADRVIARFRTLLGA